MFRRFVEANGLADMIDDTLADEAAGRIPLAEAGRSIRAAFLRGDFPAESAAAIRAAYRELSRRSGTRRHRRRGALQRDRRGSPGCKFRRATGDVPQHIRGDAVLEACRRCYASLFTDRAISYRKAKGFDHMKVALSIGVQRMVRSDLGGSGVMFSLDTETGFDRVVLINAAWGLGENVVQGAVDPDEYQVFKPFLADTG